MQYTPQQLAGGGKYSRGVRIGNWYEDSDYADAKLLAFAKKKASGGLATSQKARREQLLTQAVPHSFNKDGKLLWGYSVVVRNVKSKKTIAGDVFQRLDFGSEDSAVFTAAIPSAVACNTLVVTHTKDSPKRPEVCYGDVVNLCINPSIRADPRTGMLKPNQFFTSKKGGVSGGLSGKQSAHMGTKRSADCSWRILHVNIGKKLAVEGLPVDTNTPVLFQHVPTGQLLGSSGNFKTAGGVDEVFVGIVQTRQTRKQINPGAENQWEIVLSSDPGKAVDNRKFFKMTPDAILKQVRDVVNKRGQYGIRGLGRSFRIMDDGGDGFLDREDFIYGLKDYGCHLSDLEFDCLLTKFDANKDGFVSFDEFLRTIRGPLSARRKKFIGMAYELLDRDGSGVVNMADIEQIYDASQHPDVISGKKTESEVLREFSKQWDKSSDGTITMDEFIDYYTDVSASIDDEDYFELMMRNAWHISGGEGWSANTTCRRVLVIHKDGSQTVEEIKNDLGIKDTDIDVMIARLKKQGITDIDRIELYA